MASFIWSVSTTLASYSTVNASFARSTSTLLTPASSDRAAETEFGQLIQVAPLLLFIMPSTTMVTFAITTPAVWLCAYKDVSRPPAITWINNNRLVRFWDTSHSTRFYS